MLPRLLPLLAALMPFTAMVGAFLIGRAYGVLPDCIPVIDGCVSISATGRRPPGSFLFKAMMLPYSLVLVFVWFYAVEWLRALNPKLGKTAVRSILISGIVGALALIVYVTFLGTKEPIYEFMRRTGIYFAFVGTGLAQLFVSVPLLRIARWEPWRGLQAKARTLVSLSALLFGLGILNIIMRRVLEDPDPAENIIEWLAALGMQVHFVILYAVWRATGFRATVWINERGADGN
jgi:hypothetical protein